MKEKCYNCQCEITASDNNISFYRTTEQKEGEDKKLSSFVFALCPKCFETSVDDNLKSRTSSATACCYCHTPLWAREVWYYLSEKDNNIHYPKLHSYMHEKCYIENIGVTRKDHSPTFYWGNNELQDLLKLPNVQKWMDDMIKLSDELMQQASAMSSQAFPSSAYRELYGYKATDIIQDDSDYLKDLYKKLLK